MKVCEMCGKEHEGNYGSGRFCSSHCARSYPYSPQCRAKKTEHKGWGRTKDGFVRIINKKKLRRLKNGHDVHIKVNGFVVTLTTQEVDQSIVQRIMNLKQKLAQLETLVRR